MLALVLCMPFGPLLAWKRGDLPGVVQRLGLAIAAAILVAALGVYFTHGGPLLAPLGVGLAAFVMLGALVELAERLRLFREPAGVSWRRATGLPRSAFGATLAHFGIGVTLLGIVATSTWQGEAVTAMKPGDVARFGRYEAVFVGMTPHQGPNYNDQVARFELRKGGVKISDMTSAKRYYPARQMPTTEAGIRTFLFDQVYISLGEGQADGAIAVRLYDKPLVTLIWLGAVLMACGGLFSLSDRRLRVGATQAGARGPQAAAGGVGAMVRRLATFLLLAASLAAGPACAVEPDEVLKDPSLEARARHLSAELRCMVCQNQWIDDSDAPLAKDLRILVRERLVAGDTDVQVKQYLTVRYGFRAPAPALRLAHGASLDGTVPDPRGGRSRGAPSSAPPEKVQCRTGSPVGGGARELARIMDGEGKAEAVQPPPRRPPYESLICRTMPGNVRAPIFRSEGLQARDLLKRSGNMTKTFQTETGRQSLLVGAPQEDPHGRRVRPRRPGSRDRRTVASADDRGDLPTDERSPPMPIPALPTSSTRCVRRSCPSR